MTSDQLPAGPELDRIDAAYLRTVTDAVLNDLRVKYVPESLTIGSPPLRVPLRLVWAIEWECRQRQGDQRKAAAQKHFLDDAVRDQLKAKAEIIRELKEKP
jgi:hypothetical protein